MEVPRLFPVNTQTLRQMNRNKGWNLFDLYSNVVIFKLKILNSNLMLPPWLYVLEYNQVLAEIGQDRN